MTAQLLAWWQSDDTDGESKLILQACKSQVAWTLFTGTLIPEGH